MALSAQVLENLCLTQSVEKDAVTVIEGVNFAFLYGDCASIRRGRCLKVTRVPVVVRKKQGKVLEDLYSILFFFCILIRVTAYILNLWTDFGNLLH